MAKVAVVTGGTRGIGAAIATALKQSGHTVAATRLGHDERGDKFGQDNGIAVYRWDVADPAASADGIKRVEADLGPVEVLVNNAGITRDGMFHRMTYDQW